MNFTGCSNGGSTFSTNKPKLIEALEKSDMFGKIYRRAPECVNISLRPEKKVSQKKTEDAVKVKLVPGISGWQDAAEYLVSNFGSNAEKLTTPDLILEEAARHNVKFPEINS